ncbi:MAG: YhcN/YlaJ family sporulation lipoprotein [Thermacetogeniaceae bacterium]
MKRVLKNLMIFFLVLVFGLSGCTASRKPEKKPASPRTVQSPSTTPKTTAPSATSERAIAERIAREAVKVSGVREATVVISGRTAYIGLNLNPNVEKNRTATIKKTVADKAKAAEPSLVRVNVTSDPDLVARLKRIADGIKKGKPVSSFASELAEIERRITPKTK